MDAMITMVRLVVKFPLGLIASLLLLCVAWPFEFLVGVFCFPIMALKWPRDLMKIRYTGWPFTTFGSLKWTWRWVFDQELDTGYNTGDSPPRHLNDFFDNLGK
jgi:hypothetical protein